MPLLVHGIEVRTDDAEGLRAFEGAPAAGDFLFHLRHADGALGQIVGERHPQVRDKAQHRLGMLAHASDQVKRERLLDPTPTLVLPLDGRITLEGPVQNRMVIPEDAPCAPRTQGRFARLARRHTVVTGLDQQIHQLFGPALTRGFALKGQLSQHVRIAQGVQAVRKPPISRPAVMHRGAQQVRQDAVILDGGQTALGMHPIPGEFVARHRMQPIQVAGHAQARLVGAYHGQVDQQLGNVSDLGQQYPARLIAPGAHRARRDAQSIQFGDQVCAAQERQQLAVGQVHRQCAHVRAILHGFAHVGGKFALMHLPADAVSLPRAVFGDEVTGHGDVDDLPTFVQRLSGLRQRGPALAVLRQRVVDGDVHARGAFEGFTHVTGLCAGFLARGHVRGGALLCQTVARWRLARVVAVLGKARFEFCNTRR